MLTSCEIWHWRSKDMWICKSKMLFESFWKPLKPTNNPLEQSQSLGWDILLMFTRKVMEVLHGKENLSRLPLSSLCFWIELVASLHYTFPILQKIELKHPLSSETLLSLRSDQGMAMNNYVRDSALKWPQIFISASRQQRRERGSKFLGLSVSTVMYHTALRVLTVQLEALLRPSLSVGKTSREPDKIKSCFLKHTSGAGAINLPDCDQQGGQGAGPPQKLGLAQKAAQVGPFIPISPTKNE